MIRTLSLALALAAVTPVGAAPLTSLVIALAAPDGGAIKTVHSDAIDHGGQIADKNSAYGAGLSPEVNWSAVPRAKAYAVVLEDPDAPGAAPFVHWLVWNIPAARTRLVEGAMPGAMEGRNGHGGIGYWGPHPPSGTHHYHLEVFALDVVLPLKAGADREALVAAMRGHVLASGEVVGRYSAPAH